ncbi:Cro/CI family transcriptional regulator [Pseudomonas abietaniphila]|uniref:Cro/CI family transcriptional regulator n=1 Tax=Pseudomonas abietaniphila TaxID=89065 RepID=UPI00115FB892|nr:Cro/CI family transcriptional regulator [Pseudomonas abietaniphila]
MHRIPLAEFAAKRHAWTATRLGMSQGALSKAIREGRSIYVVDQGEAGISAVEEKPFPGQRRSGSPEPQNNNNPLGTEPSAPDVPVRLSSSHQAAP